MKGILTAVVLVVGLSSPAFAQNQNGQGGNGQGGNGQGGNGQGGNDQGGNGTRGAPAPLIGVGLPGLAVGIGYGVYWLVRRRRNVA
jgi:opacity protein-like surface antigen